MRLNKKVAPYLFISPFYILFFIFGAFPIIFSLYLSFQSWDGISPMQYVGVDNYRFVLTDPWFWKSIYNTCVIFIQTTVPQHVLALFFAFVLAYGLVKCKEFFRASYFLPYITSSVAVALLFMTIFGEQFGIVNAALKFLTGFAPFKALFGLFDIDVPVRWINSERWLKPTIAALVTWKYTGWNLIIYYAGLQKIPQSLYEAAKVDGATTRQIFFKITLPLLKPIIFFGITMSIIGNLQLFDEPMMITGGKGGPNMAGLTTAMYLYKTGFEWTEFGTGSAIAYILCCIIILFSYINHRFFRSKM